MLTPDFFENEYLQKKKSISEISRETGIDWATVKRYALISGAPLRSHGEQAVISSLGVPLKYCRVLSREFLLGEYVGAKKSMKRIAEEQGIHYGTIRDYLESNGIEVRSAREQMRLDFPPKEFPQTAESSAFFDGLLLGDGSIPRRKGGCHNIYSQGCKHCEYLEYVSKRAGAYGVSFSPIDSRWVNDSRCKNGGYFTNNLQSHSYRTFHAFRMRWYPEGSKRIPRDLCLNRDVLLQAYLSDGSYYREVFICTNGFTVSDVIFLQGLIKREVGITTRMQLDAGKPVIVIRKSDAPAFFSYIGPSPVKCYEYKWNDGRTDKKRLADNLRARQKYREERMKVS